MTHVITRFFESADQARLVARELVRQKRLSPRIVHVYDDPDGLVDTLTGADVLPATAKAYQKHMTKGGAVLMVLAGHKPLAVAKTTREVTAEMGAADMGNLVEEVEVADGPARTLSVLEGAPLMFSRPRDPYSNSYHMADWPIPLISRRKPFAEMLFAPHTRMADFFLPLISRRKPNDNFAFPRHKRMAAFPIPLLSDRKPADKFAFPRHKRMADFPIPLISRRKPYTGSVIPRHAHMATVPFPLLINGKSENSVIPGGPRMADFPIPLLSDREPKDKFAFPRHAHMANFPIPLISHRKPYTGSAIEKHGHMADFPLPLVIKHGESTSKGASGFSFSKMLGLPTLIRR